MIVTGASSGIGAATALRLAREGARVVLCARRRERLEALAREIEARSGTALTIQADVTVPDDRERVVREALAAFGRIDALVNNAGYGQRGPVELVPLDEVRRNFETNVFSLIALIQLVLPTLRAQRSGRIVNISSVAGRIAVPYSAVYAATKHAVEAISDGLRGELAPFGIQVVLIEPGFVTTEFFDVAEVASQPVAENLGPYAPYAGGAGRHFERGRRMAAAPEEIAAVIAKALTVERPRARYAAPFHARVALAARRLLPQRVFDRVLDLARR